MWIGYCQEGLKCKEQDAEFFSVQNPPFKIYGLWNPRKDFHRMPDDVAKNSSGEIFSKSVNSSGGRIRFATDSPYIVIRVKHNPYNNGSPHITRLASIGVDLYVQKDGEETYQTSFFPPIDREDGYEAIKYFTDSSMREITLYMPLGTEIYEFEIGLKSDSVLKEHKAYKIEKPIVFYGSSITNGFAASRPGTTYESFISRKLDCDFINLGFSGSAKGEIATAEYISKLKMSTFVFDYDHNAPDYEHLMATHEKFYKVIRENNPDLPIVLVTRPDSDLNEDCQLRRDAILNTYVNARKNRDKKIYYIDGYSLFPSDCRRDCTVDGCHPNDLGFYFMAHKIGGILKEIVK